jgi:lipoate-protein ligase A
MNPYRNLAIEKYFVNHLKDDEYVIYFWVNKDTIVIGRNQYAYDQFDAEAVKQDGIKISRRLSGGGAVYHDINNLLFSFIMNAERFDKNSGYDILIKALRKIGIQAEKNGRNDVTVDGRKFSGNAFLNKGNIFCHHGTVLINTDTQKMEKYLHVPKEKLNYKGVQSVKSRVVNLIEFDGELNKETVMHAVWGAASDYFGETPDVVPEEYFDAKEIEESQKAFADKGFIFGEKLDGYELKSSRIDGFGLIDLYVKQKGGIVEAVKIFTDALSIPDTAHTEKLLSGKSFDAIAELKNGENAFLDYAVNILTEGK